MTADSPVGNAKDFRNYPYVKSNSLGPPTNCFKYMGVQGSGASIVLMLGLLWRQFPIPQLFWTVQALQQHAVRFLTFLINCVTGGLVGLFFLTSFFVFSPGLWRYLRVLLPPTLSISLSSWVF